jgi:hypothetical protein
MTKQNTSSKAKKNSVAAKTSRSRSSSGEEQIALDAVGLVADRKRLLARVAGNIAAGVLQDPPMASESTTAAAAIAELAVDIAEAILQKVGL